MKNKKKYMHHKRAKRTIEIYTILRLLEHQPKKILDLGFGSGQITHILHQKGYNIIGLDVSKKHYSYAKKNFPECDFKLYDGLKIPFKDKEFDTIIMNDVFEHVTYSHMHKLIENVKRVLLPEGIIYISVTNRFELVEPHSFTPFLTWFPRIFWNPINQLLKGKEGVNVMRLYPYTFHRLRSFCKEHSLDYIDFTHVYVQHKFSDIEYIGNRILRNLVKVLKRIRLQNLFYYLAYKFSVIIFVCKIKN